MGGTLIDERDHQVPFHLVLSPFSTLPVQASLNDNKQSGECTSHLLPGPMTARMIKMLCT